MLQAWKTRWMSNVHSLARRAAGTKCGVKRRPYLAVKTNGLSTDQWLQTWGRDGAEGGIKARRLPDWF